MQLRNIINTKDYSGFLRAKADYVQDTSAKTKGKLLPYWNNC